MTAPSVAFETEYSAELIEQAARAFRDYLFKRYGPLLIGACVVNAIGFLVAFLLGGLDGLLLVGLLLVVALGPTWLLYEYFVEPHRYAATLKRSLPPHGRISVGSESVTLTVRGQEAKLPWSLIKVVVETKSFFLLVLSPFAFTVVPKSGLPREAYDALHARSQAGAA